MKIIKKLLKTIITLILIAAIVAPLIFLLSVLLEEGGKAIAFNWRRGWLLVKSVLLGINVSTVSFIVAFFMGIFLMKHSKKYMYLLVAAVMTFYFISPYIHALSWLRFIGVGKYGYLKTFIVLTMYYVPLNIMVVIVGLNSIDKDYINAAKIYKSDDVIVYKIILRMLKPYALSLMSLVFIFVISDFSVPSLFQLKTYSFEVFTYYTSGSSFRELILLSMPLFIVNGLAFGLLFIFSGKMSFSGKGSSAFVNTSLKLNLVNNVFSVMAILLMVLLSFVIFSNFFQLLKTDILALTFSENIKELIYSLKMSFVASFFGTLILVFILNNYDNNLFKLIILSPLLFPGALMGVSIISVFIGSEHYSYLMGKDILLIYSNTIKSLPVIYFFLKGSLDTKDKNIIDCGKIYQKNIFHRIRYIDIPYFLIPILGGIYLGFSYIFGEISSSILLIPPGKQLISLKIYSYLHYGSGSKISALGFIIIAFFTVTTSLILLFINKKRRYIR